MPLEIYCLRSCSFIILSNFDDFQMTSDSILRVLRDSNSEIWNFFCMKFSAFRLLVKSPEFGLAYFFYYDDFLSLNA